MADFVWKIKNGELEAVEKCVQEKPDIVKEEASGRYPLHFAADYGQAKVIECLVKNGAKVDQKDSHGITPLLAAIWEDHAKAVEALIAAGANTNGKSPDGKSYLENAESDKVKALLQ